MAEQTEADESDENVSVRAFCADESRFGIFPTGKRRITDFGVKPIAEIEYQYDWFYLYGAAEPTTGEAFFFNSQD